MLLDRARALSERVAAALGGHAGRGRSAVGGRVAAGSRSSCRRPSRSGCAHGSPHCRRSSRWSAGRRADARRRPGRASRPAARSARIALAPRDRARPTTSPRSSRSPTRPTRQVALPTARPALSAAGAAEAAGARPRRRGSSSSSEIRGDLHCHTVWSDGRATVLEMAEAARARGLRVPRDLRPHDERPRRAGARCRRRCAARPMRSRAANEVLAPFRVLAGIECDILPDGRLDLPDDVLAELDWVQISLHAGQRTPRRELTARVVARDAAPGGSLPQPPDRTPDRSPAGERARPRADDRDRARDGRRARGERSSRRAST